MRDRNDDTHLGPAFMAGLFLCSTCLTLDDLSDPNALALFVLQGLLDIADAEFRFVDDI